MKSLFNTYFLILLFFANCSEDEGIDCFTCTYEERKTSCSSSGFGPWESETATIDFELKDGLTPQQYCKQAYPASDLECSATCCISFQFRNVEVGSCP